MIFKTEEQEREVSEYVEKLLQDRIDKNKIIKDLQEEVEQLKTELQTLTPKLNFYDNVCSSFYASLENPKPHNKKVIASSELKVYNAIVFAGKNGITKSELTRKTQSINKLSRMMHVKKLIANEKIEKFILNKSRKPIECYRKKTQQD